MPAKKTAKKTAKRRKATTRKKPKESSSKRATPSPRSGYSLPLGNHPGNTGGKPGRSGRRPNWIKQRCRDLVDELALLDVAGMIAVGDIWEELQTMDGPISAPTRVKDRLAAIRFLVEHGDGRPTVKIAGDDDGDPIGVAVERYEATVGALMERLARMSKRQRKRRVSKKSRS